MPQGQVAGFLPETKAGCCHSCPSNGTQDLQGWGTYKTTQETAEGWMVGWVLLLVLPTLLLHSMPCFMSFHIRHLKQISETYPKDVYSSASFIEVTLENIEIYRYPQCYCMAVHLHIHFIVSSDVYCTHC